LTKNNNGQKLDLLVSCHRATPNSILPCLHRFQKHPIVIPTPSIGNMSTRNNNDTAITVPAASSICTNRYQYSVALCYRLADFNFDAWSKQTDLVSRVPKHILGFSPDFRLTWKRYRAYEGAIVENGTDLNVEWNKWNTLDPLSQQMCERNIALQKEQQLQVRHPQTTSPFAIQQRPPFRVAAVSPSGIRSVLQHQLQQKQSVPAVGGTRHGGQRSHDADRDAAAAQLAAMAGTAVYHRHTKKRKTHAKTSSGNPWTPKQDRKVLAGIHQKLSFQEIADTYFADGSRFRKAIDARWRKLMKDQPQKTRTKRGFEDEDSDESSDENEDKTAPSRRGWTGSEDSRLKSGVSKEMSFGKISQLLFADHRSASSCRHRWISLKAGDRLETQKQ
jgi:hypothetical protein